MKSQPNQLLEKINNCHIHVKQHSKPSIHFKKMVLTYHWSLAINKLQKIFTLRCKMALQILKNEDQQMKQSRSEQNSQIFINKLNKHVRQSEIKNILLFILILIKKYYINQNNQKRLLFQNRLYLSQQPQIESDSQLEKDQISDEQIDDQELHQKKNHSQNQLLKLDITKIQNQQSDVKESAHFRSQNSLDQLRFNEEFLELFKKQRELSQFGQLSQNKIKEQEILIKKIIDSRPCKPHPDLKTFLSLLKKPQIEIQQTKILQQNQQPVYLILIILFISLISIYIIV